MAADDTEAVDDVYERIQPLLNAVATFRTLNDTGSGAGADWKRSAYENLMRELRTFQITEESKRLAELEGLLRDILEHLENGSEMAGQIREALGLDLDPPV